MYVRKTDTKDTFLKNYLRHSFCDARYSVTHYVICPWDGTPNDLAIYSKTSNPPSGPPTVSL